MQNTNDIIFIYLQERKIKDGTSHNNIYIIAYHIWACRIFNIAIEISRNKGKRFLELYTGKPNVRQAICVFKKI